MISRIGASRASSARLASSSSPGGSLAPFTIRPCTVRLRPPRGLERERGVVDGAASGPADDHEREAERLGEIRRRAVPADGGEQAGRPFDEHAVAAAAQGEVDLAHVVGVDRGDRVASPRGQQVLARRDVRRRADGAGNAPDQPARGVVLADLNGGQHGGRETCGPCASREQGADVRLADAVIGAGDEYVEQCLGHGRSVSDAQVSRTTSPLA